MDASKETKKDEQKSSTVSILGYQVPLWLLVVVVLVLVALAADKYHYINIGIFSTSEKIALPRSEVGFEANVNTPVDELVRRNLGNSASLGG